jgi:hypothetical protein
MKCDPQGVRGFSLAKTKQEKSAAGRCPRCGALALVVTMVRGRCLACCVMDQPLGILTDVDAMLESDVDPKPDVRLRKPSLPRKRRRGD